MVALLRGERQVLGTLVVANRLGEFGSFSDDELQLFETLAAHAAVTLEATRLDRELTQLHRVDGRAGDSRSTCDSRRSSRPWGVSRAGSPTSSTTC